VRKLLLGALAVLIPMSAMAETYQVGEHVTSQRDGISGTVIEVGQQLADGGTFIKVHLDTLSPAFPNVGVWWDTAMVRATADGGGPAPPNAPPQPPQAPPQQPAQPPRAPPPQPPQQPANTQLPAAPNPNTNQASAALCQQLIRARYVAPGTDSTVTVNFQSFQMAGAAPSTSTYADSNWMQPPGEQVSASKIETRYTVLTHYNDPQSDDQLRTITATYECYRHPTAGWLVEQTYEAPGSETSQYIKKG
jgi:hypothetical protein